MFLCCIHLDLVRPMAAQRSSLVCVSPELKLFVHCFHVAASLQLFSSEAPRSAASAAAPHAAAAAASAASSAVSAKL